MKAILNVLIVFLFSISFFSCSDGKKPVPNSESCEHLNDLPYTTLENFTIAYNNNRWMFGGNVADSITKMCFVIDSSGNAHTDTTRALPKNLMSGFGFRLKDSVYYGGGYEPNWNTAYPSTIDTQYCIKYPIAARGFISSDSGKIYRTLNSGTNWDVTNLGTKAPILTIDFVNSNTGWTASDSSSSKIFKTTNSGDAWTVGTVAGNIRIKAIDFINTNEGWAAGSEGKIFKTVNGGTSWDTTARRSFNNLNSVFFLNNKFGWACGENGRIVRTTDGGTSWDSTTFTSKNLYSVKFKDTLTGYTAGADGTLGRSTNGGVTWSLVTVESSDNLRSIDLRNSDSVVVCGDKGTILNTNNGILWQRVYGLTPNNLYSICLIPGTNKTAVCGSNGFTSYANNGCFKYTVSKSFYSLALNNPAAKWIPKVDLPRPISEVFSSGCSLNDSLGYIFGGKTSGDTVLNTVYRYSSKTGKWTECTKLPTARSYGGLAVVSDTTMVFLGGKNSTSVSDTLYNVKVSSANPDSLKITFASSYPLGKVYAMNIQSIEGLEMVLILGGKDSTGNMIKAGEAYNAITSTYTQICCNEIINWLGNMVLDGVINLVDGASLLDGSLDMQTVYQTFYDDNKPALDSMSKEERERLDACVISLDNDLSKVTKEKRTAKNNGMTEEVLKFKVLTSGGVDGKNISLKKNYSTVLKFKFK